MPTETVLDEPLLNISEVERATGIAKETLRVWERRYGFPQPGRDQYGERTYCSAQVERLGLIKRLIDSGHRPGKLMQYGQQELANLLSTPAQAIWQLDKLDPVLQAYLQLIKQHQVDELRQRLAQALVQFGLRQCILEILAPLTSQVGEAWASGYFAVYEEHLYTEALQSVLRSAIVSLHVQPNARPRILLTTIPQENHALGLLMAQALLTLSGAHCISLGVQTPVAEMVQACVSQDADIVALSFSSALSPRLVQESVQDLCNRLPQGMECWAGGQGAQVLAMTNMPKTAVVPCRVLDMREIDRALCNWREENFKFQPQQTGY